MRMWKSSYAPTNRPRGKEHAGASPRSTSSDRTSVFYTDSALLVKFMDFILRPEAGADKRAWYRSVRDLSAGLWVCNVWSWFACLFQVRDHGADGRVTGDVVWAALPLGSEWVQHTYINTTLCAHIVRGLRAEAVRNEYWTVLFQVGGMSCTGHIWGHMTHNLWLSRARRIPESQIFLHPQPCVFSWTSKWE